MTDACSFAACDSVGDHRVVVTAAEAASWALRPGLLALVDSDTANDANAAVGLLFCAAHAAGVEREHFRARAGGLNATEQRVLRHIQGEAARGGATIEGMRDALRLSESSVMSIVRRLVKARVVVKSRFQGTNRAGRRVAKYMAVTDQHEPPPVQPTLLDGEEAPR